MMRLKHAGENAYSELLENVVNHNTPKKFTTFSLLTCLNSIM